MLENQIENSVDAIIKKVHELKPHFSEQIIRKAHACLSDKNFLHQ